MSIENKVYLIDNMEYMATVPDKFFDLAPVDVGYGIGAGKNKRGGLQHGNSVCKSKEYHEYNDQVPDENYFKELFRISKYQIIWGANHFISKIPFNSSAWIVWDKLTGNNGYADCELAWTSFDCAVRKFTYQWAGMLQGNMKNKENRIHINQKPVALYKWILKNYAQPGWKIFDSHVGSGSSRIACHDMGFDFKGCELDPDYWQAQEDRFNNYISQQDIFPTEEIQDLIFQGNVV